MRVFITGGTGLVGQRLVQKLLEFGNQPVVLTRRPDAAKQIWAAGVLVVAGDPMQPGPWQQSLAECDAVVNLAGEGIFNRRWSPEFKELMTSSRVKSTANVVAGIAAKKTCKTLVNASAIGFYGSTGPEELTEQSPAGNDTLAHICLAWEKAAESAAAHDCRVAIVRIGVVLDASGGALGKMLTPFKMFVGGPVGSGQQYMSWIHHEDLVGLIQFALANSQAQGPINATAPRPVTNQEFSKALGRALHRPSFLPTPAFALRLALGEVAELITKGQRVLPQRALELGYKFQFADIDTALQQLFK